MKKILISGTVAVAIASTCMAEIPAGYYNRLDGKADAELKAAAHDIINPHTLISSYSDLPQYFQQTDVRPDSRQWWDMYSAIARYIPSFSGLNREHSFPKSWWGGSTSTPAYIDLNHLYPADGPANQAKSNYPMGEVTSGTKCDNGVTLVGPPVSGQGGGAAYVFEPADEYKGDFARTYFYFVTCYSNLTWARNYSWMLQQNAYPTLAPWAIELLLKWSRMDPVSQKEYDRNEVVYSYQNNRNPFIDFPELAEYIWGNKKGEKFSIGGGSGGEAILTAPANGIALDFGQVAVGSEVKKELFIKGENLTSPLNISYGGTDRAMFSLPGNQTSVSINHQLVNGSSGYQLQITYKPTAIGQHTARLNLYDGGITGSVRVELHGEALDVPVLSAVTAYEASDITNDSYVASWSAAPDNETVDFYVFNRTRYVGQDVETETIECDGTSIEITDFNGSDRETYTVQTSRLGYLSPPSNMIFVGHSGVSDIEAQQPLIVKSYPGVIRIHCSGIHTDGRIYDASGRLHTILPEVTDGLELTLPVGFYLLTTAEHPVPVKIMAR